MKKNLFLCLSILFANLIWSQQQNYTVNPTSSVEVGINTPFSFSFKPVTNIPQLASDQPAVSSYRLTAWFISSANSNMNNSGNGSFNDNSQSLNSYGIDQNQTLNFPIRWDDNSNQLTDIINISTTVNFYNSNGYVSNYIYTHSVSININRVLTPIINTPIILSCCSAPVSFFATNFGTANVFNWTVSGGTYTGNSSAITVIPSTGSGVVSVSCTVSRSGNPSYNRSNSVNIAKTNRSTTFDGIYSSTNYQSFDFFCKGSGRQMSMPTQCGFSSVVWTAPNCTITGQGTLSPTIIPINTIANGSNITISALVTFSGGCTTTASKVFKVLASGTPPIPAGSLTFITNGTTCNPTSFVPRFTPSSSAPFVNGIIEIDPPVIIPGKGTGPYSFDVCYVNLCDNSYTCKTFIKGTPAPCVSSRMANTNSEIKLIVAPNPSNGNIKVTLPSVISGTYEIYDQTNNLLVQKAQFNNQSEIQLDLSQKLKDGIYIIKVITEENVFTEKIILKK